MVKLSVSKFREKALIAFLVIFCTVFTIYLYLNHLQESYKNVQWSGDRCLSELSSIKYQLNVVTEYKNRIDKLLTDTHKSHESDKERFKEIMETCVTMKQQTSICQSQFEDLQVECKKTREDYNRVVKELDNTKKT